jgi:molecular chaperone DnaK
MRRRTQKKNRRKKQLAEARNETDTLVYTVEKSRDYGDKVSEPEKKEIEEALERCKKLKDTSNEVSEIKSAIENLMTKSHKLAEHLYKGAGAQEGAGPQTGEGENGPEEEVVEAEFEDVDKDKKGS